MAAFDSMLRVMSHRGAEAMTVASGQIPQLRRAGNAEPMAMPALEPAMVATFVDEIVPAEARAELEARRAGEYVYRATSGDVMIILVELTTAGHRMMVRRQPPTAAAPTAPAPAPRPVSAPAKAAAASLAATPFAAPSSLPDPGPGLGLGLASDAPDLTAVPSSLRALINDAAARNASDLLLSETRPPRVRVDGDILALDEPPSTAAELLTLITAARHDGAAALAARGAVDFGATIDGHRLRGHGFRHERGLGLAIRIIRRDVPTVRSLGLPDDLTDLARVRSGLVLVAGPTGSGKSTTLVALVEHLNRTAARHIVTLEDPIEYEYEPAECLIHQREIGRHTPSFADGLRAALREAPDVIVVGELRDRDTISIALTAAETGHLVLGTVHAPGAAIAIDRLIDAFPEHQQRQARSQLAAVLRAVVTQHLVPTRAGRRAPAIERVQVNAAVASLIRKNELQMLATHVQTGRDAGMIPLEKSLARLVRSGSVEARVARSVAADPDFFDAALRA